MTLYAAILTLSASAATLAPGSFTLDALEAVDHVALPAPRAGALSLRVYALEALVVVGIPSRSAPDLARAVRKAPRAVCTGVEERPFEIQLRCRSKRIVARLARREAGYLLEIGEARGLPWGGLDGAVLVPFDARALGLAEDGPAAAAEAQLARGDRAGARAALRRIVDGPALDLAQLREGDLALEAGDVAAAARAWERVQADPWRRLAAARLCEASWSCLAAARTESLYSTQGLPETLERDLVLRSARALAFLDRPGDAAHLLLAGDTGRMVCAAAPALCQRVCLAALRAPGADAVEGLLLWLDLPERSSAAAYRIELAAAAAAERVGAPTFGASVLAAAVAHVPARSLDEHLLRTSELYLAGGDRVRAGVILEFARSRLGKKALGGSRWAAVARATSRADAPPKATEPVPAQPDDAFLAAAVRTTEAARALSQGGRP